MLKMHRRDASGSHGSGQSNTSAASRLSAKITSKVKRVVHKFEKLGNKHKTKHQLVEPVAELAYATEGSLSPLKANNPIKVAVFAHDGSADIRAYTAITTDSNAVKLADIQANTALTTGINVVKPANTQANTAITTAITSVKPADTQVNTAITTAITSVKPADTQVNTAITGAITSIKPADTQVNTAITTAITSAKPVDAKVNAAITTDNNVVEHALADTEIFGMVKRRKTMFSRLARKSIDATTQLKDKLSCRRPSLPKFSMSKFEALVRKFSPTGHHTQFPVPGDGDIRGIYYPEVYYPDYRRSPETLEDIIRKLSSLGIRTRSQLSILGYIPAPTYTANGSPIIWGNSHTDPEDTYYITADGISPGPSPYPHRFGPSLADDWFPTPYPRRTGPAIVNDRPATPFPQATMVSVHSYTESENTSSFGANELSSLSSPSPHRLGPSVANKTLLNSSPPASVVSLNSCSNSKHPNSSFTDEQPSTPAPKRLRSPVAAHWFPNLCHQKLGPSNSTNSLGSFALLHGESDDCMEPFSTNALGPSALPSGENDDLQGTTPITAIRAFALPSGESDVFRGGPPITAFKRLSGDDTTGAPCPYTPAPSPRQAKSLLAKKRNQRRNRGYPQRTFVDFGLAPPKFRLGEAPKDEDEWWYYLGDAAPTAAPTAAASRSASPSPPPCGDRPSARLGFYEEPPSASSSSPSDSSCGGLSAWDLADDGEVTLARLADLLLGENHPDRRVSDLEEEHLLQTTVRVPVPGRVPRALELAHPQPISCQMTDKMRALAEWGL